MTTRRRLKSSDVTTKFTALIRTKATWNFAVLVGILIGFTAGSSAAASLYSDLILSHDPVAYWRLEETTTGSTAVNSASGVSSAGVAADGTYSAGVQLNQSSLLRSGDGSAMRVLNTTLDRMATAGFEKFAGGSGFTVENWVQFNTAPTNYQNIVGDRETGSDFNLMQYRVSASGIRPHVQTNSGYSSIDTSGQPFTETVNSIHHVVSTWDASTGILRAYIDGRLQSVTTTRTGTPVNTDNPIYIGRDNLAANTSTMTVDEVALYNRRLTTDEVRSHFNRGNFGNLIETFDYTDTFTDTVFGGITGRATNGVYPVGSPGINVEDTYGNSAVAWTNAKWSLNRDSTVSGSPFSSNLRGSVSGFTQTGGGTDFGIEYGLREEYVVQFDAVQADDRINITSSNVRDTIGGGASVGLSVFFRGDDYGGPNGNIGIFNGVTETDSGLGLIGVDIGEWATYSVRFDRIDQEIEIFVNQNSLGVLDLTTFAGGLYANWSNAAVSVGGTGFVTSSNAIRTWTDNFAVGSAVIPVPEPNAIFLLVLGLVGICGIATYKSKRCSWN